jgi:hypothetical protein
MQGFRFGSEMGPIYIVPGQDEWHATLGNALLGAYKSAQQAVSDLAHGITAGNSAEFDTSTLDLPERIGDWEIVHF